MRIPFLKVGLLLISLLVILWAIVYFPERGSKTRQVPTSVSSASTIPVEELKEIAVKQARIQRPPGTALRPVRTGASRQRAATEPVTYKVTYLSGEAETVVYEKCELISMEAFGRTEPWNGENMVFENLTIKFLYQGAEREITGAIAIDRDSAPVNAKPTLGNGKILR